MSLIKRLAVTFAALTVLFFLAAIWTNSDGTSERLAQTGALLLVAAFFAAIFAAAEDL